MKAREVKRSTKMAEAANSFFRHVRFLATQLFSNHVKIVVWTIVAPVQSLVLLDAIWKALYRTMAGKNLLEWTPASLSETISVGFNFVDAYAVLSSASIAVLAVERSSHVMSIADFLFCRFGSSAFACTFA
jgi:hypothetical protein